MEIDLGRRGLVSEPVEGGGPGIWREGGSAEGRGRGARNLREEIPLGNE